jgi:hypothetical protein
MEIAHCIHCHLSPRLAIDDAILLPPVATLPSVVTASTVAACRSWSCALLPPPAKAGQQCPYWRSRVDNAIADVSRCIDCGNCDKRHNVVLPCFGLFHSHPVVAVKRQIAVGAAPFESQGGNKSRHWRHCAARPL